MVNNVLMCIDIMFVDDAIDYFFVGYIKMIVAFFNWKMKVIEK